MQSSARRWLLSVAVFAVLAAACGTPSALPSASASTNVTLEPSPLASAAASAIESPLRFQFVRGDGGGTVTIDVDDQSGLLVDLTEGKSFFVENNESVVFQNDAADDSILHVGWVAGGGCAANYSMTIGPAARTIRIGGPPAGSDSIGGNCDVTLRFSQPVLAKDVEGELVQG